ncbi:MAG: hypothetical protein ABI835_14710 [Chloroflexota bacterium]
MTTYGLLLVDTSWANNDSVQIDKTTHLRHKDRLIEGAKALIYVREPVDAVVAEAEVTGKVIETESAPHDPAFNPAIPANLRLEREIDRIEAETAPPSSISPNLTLANNFHLPLQITRLKGQSEPIPLNRLRMLLGSDFSVYDETWIPLSEAQYAQITGEWKENAR